MFRHLLKKAPSTKISVREIIELVPKIFNATFAHPQALAKTTPIKQKIGILGGTFDPIHTAHVRIAETVKKALGLDEVRFMPAYKPADKKPGTSALDRLKMVELAIEGNKDLKVETCEYKREETSLTVDTLKILRAQNPNASLSFIVGMDSLKSFHTWDGADEILSNSHLIVADRPKYELPKSGAAATFIHKYLKHGYSSIRDNPAGNIVLCPINPPSDTSSTEVRAQLAAGKNPEGMLHPKVYEYIRARGLYGTAKKPLEDSKSMDSVKPLMKTG